LLIFDSPAFSLTEKSPEPTMENAVLISEVMKYTVIAAGLLIGLGALGTAIGFALLGGKFIEGARRGADHRRGDRAAPDLRQPVPVRARPEVIPRTA
jgi:hypothetical protein